jgi:hypothetical protein
MTARALKQKRTAKILCADLTQAKKQISTFERSAAMRSFSNPNPTSVNSLLTFYEKCAIFIMYMSKITQKSHQITLAALAVGALIVPIQSALSDVTLDTSADTNPAKIQVEHHPHPSDPGSWQNHYIDPRSIRAVGHDSGKSDERSSLQNPWKIYHSRTV